MSDGKDNFQGDRPSNPPEPIGPIRRLAGPPPVVNKTIPQKPIRRRVFLARVVMLCVRPEEWAEAGLYSLRSTMLAILIIILVATAAEAASCALRVAAQVDAITQHYAQLHPPMLLTNGHLVVTGPPGKLSSTLAVSSKTLNSRLEMDPKHGLRLADVRGRNAQKLTHASVLNIQRLLDHKLRAMALAAHQKPPPATVKVRGTNIPPPIAINSKTIARVGYAVKVYASCAAVIFTSLFVFFGDALWAVFIVFLVSPIVFLINRESGMPRSVAQRIALAITAPLITLSAVLHVLQISPEQTWPYYRYGIMAGWWVVGMSFAAWAGVISKQMVAPARRRVA